MSALNKSQNSYFGGKGSDGTFQKIINHIPKCELYIETHAGFAKIAKSMLLPGICILNDIDVNVCNHLKDYFQERTIAFSDAVPNLKKMGDGHGKEIFDTISKTPIIIIENLDASALLEKYKFWIELFETVIYSDPPYPLNSRKNTQKVYDFEMSDTQHSLWLDQLKNVRCKQLISTYPNEIYKSALSDYRLFEFYSQTRKGLALENLYMNFDEPENLQDAKYFGKNFRERERYKLIKNNFLQKFKSFPIQLQNSILSEL